MTVLPARSSLRAGSGLFPVVSCIPTTGFLNLVGTNEHFLNERVQKRKDDNGD